MSNDVTVFFKDIFCSFLVKFITFLTTIWSFDFTPWEIFQGDNILGGKSLPTLEKILSREKYVSDGISCCYHQDDGTFCSQVYNTLICLKNGEKENCTSNKFICCKGLIASPKSIKNLKYTLLKKPSGFKLLFEFLGMWPTEFGETD